MLNSLYSQARQLFHRLFENELIRRVVKNSGYLFSATVITAAIGMVQSILAARLLGVAAFGVLGVITVFATVLNKLVSFRMSELVVKYVGQFTETGDQPRGRGDISKPAALAELGASVLAFTLIWLLAPLGARYFAKDPATADWFVLYGLVILANLIAESSTGLLQIFNRFRQFSVISIISSLVTLSIIVIVYFSHGGFLGVLIAYISGKTFDAIGLSVLALREALPPLGQPMVAHTHQLAATTRTPDDQFCNQHEHQRLAQPDHQRQRAPVGSVCCAARLRRATTKSPWLWQILCSFPSARCHRRLTRSSRAKWRARTGTMCATCCARARSWQAVTPWL